MTESTTDRLLRAQLLSEQIHANDLQIRAVARIRRRHVAMNVVSIALWALASIGAWTLAGWLRS